MRHVLKFDPKEARAVLQLIQFLSVQNAGKNADEIASLFQQYRKLVPFEENPDRELELFGVDRLVLARQFKQAAAILWPFVEFGIHGGDPEGVCVHLMYINPENYKEMPEFQTELSRVNLYCTGREHEFAGLRLEDEKRFPEAAQEFELQIRTNPHAPAAYRDLARVYLRMGQQNDAVRVLNQFLNGEWGQKAKCGLLMPDLPYLPAFPAAPDPALDRFLAACKELK